MHNHANGNRFFALLPYDKVDKNLCSITLLKEAASCFQDTGLYLVNNNSRYLGKGQISSSISSSR